MSLLRSKLTLTSSKLKAGENTFVLFLLILSWGLFSLSITLLGSGILFQNVSSMPPAYDALVHTADLAQCAWSESPLDGTELQQTLQVLTEWKLKPWNQTRIILKLPFPLHAWNVCAMDMVCSALSGLFTRLLHIAKPDWATET